MKQRIVDLITLVAAAGVLLVAYYTFGTIKRHHELVDALTDLVQQQTQSAPPAMPAPPPK